MRRRRQQKLERKLQQFRSKDGGPDTGGTLKIYGEAICKDVPYKTLLISIRDNAAYVTEEMLEKYGRDRREAIRYCLVQCTTMDQEGVEPKTQDYYLEDDECPLEILMNHPPARGLFDLLSFNIKGPIKGYMQLFLCNYNSSTCMNLKDDFCVFFTFFVRLILGIL